jgi:hypothetical protein
VRRYIVAVVFGTDPVGELIRTGDDSSQAVEQGDVATRLVYRAMSVKSLAGQERRMAARIAEMLPLCCFASHAARQVGFGCIHRVPLESRRVQPHPTHNVIMKHNVNMRMKQQ